MAAQAIKTHYMPGIDFSKYKTYKWVKISNVQYPNSILDDEIMQAIDSQLALKGLSKTEDNPDLYAIYQVAVNQEVQWNSYNTGGNYWGGAVGVVGAECQRQPLPVKRSISERSIVTSMMYLKNRFGAVKRARR
jgi:hypothetical protein